MLTRVQGSVALQMADSNTNELVANVLYNVKHEGGKLLDQDIAINYTGPADFEIDAKFDISDQTLTLEMYQTSTKIKIVLIDNCASKTSSVSYKTEDYEIYGKQIARTESFSEAKPTWW